jgi:serine/threonine-protein kinase
MIATLAGRYRIERELGQGGMATVYLAQDVALERRVALKVLRPELASSLGRERFLREIEIGARLSHPNILPVQESGEADGRMFYAMPYVEGESLRQRLLRERQLSIPETIAIVAAVAGALTYAHQHGVVHRDIKPENILLAVGNGENAGQIRPLVADFGIARALDVARAEKLTATGLALGTPSYMSPEQSAAGGRIDGRSDIYSLACVAYEMLAGEPPFTGPSSQAILARHSVDPVPSLRTVRSTVPAGAEYAITRALSKVPADRFATAAEFAEALSADSAPGLSSRRRMPLHRAALLLGIPAAAAAVGFGAWMLRGSTPAVIAPAARIAVLPVASAAGDTGMVRLGRDLAVTVSASLDGVGGIETADRLSLVNATANRTNLSAADAAALARRLGASSMLRGTLVRAGDIVRLDLGLYSTEGIAPLAEGITVSAHRDSIGVLTDSVTWALLRQVWQRGEPPSPSLAAVTTRSLPALRAFLEGERELAANRWTEAGLAYAAAIALDSAFVLAHFRYAYSQTWLERDVEPEVTHALRAHRNALPERERLLVAATFDSMRYSERFGALRAVTERYPEYWPGWLAYADIHVHAGPWFGYDWREGLSALHRAVTLKPDLVPAWEHIDRLTYGRDWTEDSTAASRLAQLGYAFPGAGEPLFRLQEAVFRAGGTIPREQSTLVDSVVILMVGGSDPSALELSDPNPAYHFVRVGYAAAQVEINQRALRLARNSQTRSALRTANAWAWAARGRWDSALANIAEAASERPGVLGIPRQHGVGGAVPAIESYALAVLGAWLGAIDTAVPAQRRAGAMSAAENLSDSESRRDAKGRVAWLDGLLAVARGNGGALAEARRAAAMSGYYQDTLVDRSLAAFAAARRGDRLGAGRQLARLADQCNDTPSCNHITPPIAVQRLAAAGWLAEAGDLEQARRLLRYQDKNCCTGWQSGFEEVLRAPTLLARARLEERIGDRPRAVEFYEQFLHIYDHPMAPLAHLREEARSALGRLGAAAEGAEP